MKYDIYTKALKKYGYRSQLLILIEEMSELTKAIIKQFRMSDDFFYTESIIEEMVDVDIMLMQMKTGFDAEHKKTYENIYNNKLYRLNERMNK